MGVSAAGGGSWLCASAAPPAGGIVCRYPPKTKTPDATGMVEHVTHTSCSKWKIQGVFSEVECENVTVNFTFFAKCVFGWQSVNDCLVALHDLCGVEGSSWLH